MIKAAELEEVRRAAMGDDSAMAELLQRHYTFVYKYLVKVTMDPNLAEALGTAVSVIAAVIWTGRRRKEAHHE
ncbi:hypothetical protein [Paenibacillus sp. PCH8]|uniref:hypothetical protein n=1 Tax=Paenibacillus sp. PCH8 TaxID=2066524 RepID=UPI0011AFE67A|nr:hypothetical protein [Paenibacillus sp. PCH8]